MEIVLALVGLAVALWMILSARNRHRSPPDDADDASAQRKQGNDETRD